MKIWNKLLVLLMSVLMVLMSPMQALAVGEAANQAGDYLGEVYVAVAKTPDEAAKSLTDKGYTVLERDGKPADLNQGAGSALKEDAAVVLGYKTTGDRAKAITDLAVMNMNGGYSVMDYQALMDRYRDAQVRPFIERFMAAVREYRENAASDIAGNRARADFVRAMLNRVVDDDTGGRLGDLLLNQTRAELGDAYEGLSEDEKRGHIDLELALMQGSAEVVYQAEQLLGYATDTAETTWLERLSALGPDGLAASYGDQRPSDARNSMDGQYQDIAVRLSQDWEDVRAALLAYDTKVGGQSAGSPSEDQSVQEVGDEVDTGSILNLDVEVSSGEEGRQPTVQDTPEVLEQINGGLSAINETAESVNDTRIAAIHTFLKATPYGEGTLYDLFIRPSSEVTGDGIAELYPIASCLSAGQVATLEFLPLERMLQIGVTSSSAIAEAWTANTGLQDVPELVQDVSLYQGVNREIFSDQTALTSDALRAQALEREDTGAIDFLSRYKTSLLLWAGTAVSALFAGVSAYKYAKFTANKQAMLNTVNDAMEYMKDAANKMNQNSVYRFEDIGKITLEPISSKSGAAMQATFSMKKAVNPLNAVELQRIAELKKIRFAGGMTAEQMDELNGLVSRQMDNSKVETVSDYFDNSVGLQQDTYEYKDLMNELESKHAGYKSTTSKWGVVRNVFTVATVILLIASLWSSISDIVAYYNVRYAPIPKFIVDERDITTTAADGSMTVVRNDTAYYEAVYTDHLRESEEDDKALKNYADLNGDKGKEWLALYALRGSGDPILADSLKVVTGTSSLPYGYSTGIHMFGSDSAFNLTDPRYCYNDKANGVYTYFTRKALEATVASSAFASGGTAVIGGLCLAAGAAIGAGGMYLVGRRRTDSD